MCFAGGDDSVESRELSHLAPQIVRVILHSTYPVELTPRRLVALSKILPTTWAQRQLLGFAPN